MRRLIAFINGMMEFRSAFTKSYGWPLIMDYDRGREFMHRVTLRRYDA